MKKNIAGYSPIFDKTFGWINPVGGGDPTPEEAKAKADAAAKVKAEVEAKAKAAAEEQARIDKENQDNAGKNAIEVARLKKENEDLAKFKKDAEEKVEADRIAKLEGEEKQKAIAEAETKKREDMEAENKRLKLDAAVSDACAKSAADGKEIIKEFLQPVTKVEDIPGMLEKAWERQGEVMSDRINPNLPEGGGDGSRKPKQVQGAETALKTWKKYQDMVASGDRTPATSRAWNKARRDLIAAGISPITEEAIPKG